MEQILKMNEGLANIMEKEKIKKDADKLMIKKIEMYENQCKRVGRVRDIFRIVFI